MEEMLKHAPHLVIVFLACTKTKVPKYKQFSYEQQFFINFNT